MKITYFLASFKPTAARTFFQNFTLVLRIFGLLLFLFGTTGHFREYSAQLLRQGGWNVIFSLENLVENSLQRQQKEEKWPWKSIQAKCDDFRLFGSHTFLQKVSRYNFFLEVRYERNRYRSTHESSSELNRTFSWTKSQHIENRKLFHWTRK